MNVTNGFLTSHLWKSEVILHNRFMHPVSSAESKQRGGEEYCTPNASVHFEETPMWWTDAYSCRHRPPFTKKPKEVPGLVRFRSRCLAPRPSSM
jgi:hypothetical protein